MAPSEHVTVDRSVRCLECGGPIVPASADIPYGDCLLCSSTFKYPLTLARLNEAIQKRDTRFFDMEGNDYVGENLVRDIQELGDAVGLVFDHPRLSVDAASLTIEGLLQGPEDDGGAWFWNRMSLAAALLHEAIP